jgi:hypothetical protein
MAALINGGFDRSEHARSATDEAGSAGIARLHGFAKGNFGSARENL